MVVGSETEGQRVSRTIFRTRRAAIVSASTADQHTGAERQVDPALLKAGHTKDRAGGAVTLPRPVLIPGSGLRCCDRLR